MVLTPLDLQNKDFKKVLRGYSEQEVDSFLTRVIRDYEQIYRENQELQDEIHELKEKLEQYQVIKDTLQNTMVLAQQTAEEVKRNAAREASVLVEKGQLQVENMIREAVKKTETINQEYERLRLQAQAFRVQFKSFLHAQLEMLENPLGEGEEVS